MIKVNGNIITDLYTKNILGEYFPEYCFSDTNTLECTVDISETNSSVTAILHINGGIYTTTEQFTDHLNNKLATTTAIGKSVNSYAKSVYRPCPPYGVLTGVRPFKIAIDLLARFDYDEVINRLKNTYLISEDKIELLLSTAMYDQKLKLDHHKNDVSIYVSIPFCPSRCNYCSFISSAAPSKLSILDDYVDELIREISLVSSIIEKKSLTVRSVYVGGGTPTTLNSTQLDRLLSHIRTAVLPDRSAEFTLEAGRPDTITRDKLEIMIGHGITRTCVNCQSTDDSVLEAIGRAHTSEDFFKSFELVREFDFDTVNTDIIAGLETDTFETFKKTVDDVIGLYPESISVHALSIKKSASIKDCDNIDLNKNISDYIDYSRSSCILNGFLPYYLYKQKYSLGNHENVGYCLNSHECHYNIAMMNEIEHVIGIGAGASSRVIGRDASGKNEHFYNYKYPFEYIGGSEKAIANLSEMEQLL